MVVTEPISEFSIGRQPASARPSRTAATTSFTSRQGSAVEIGPATARCGLAERSLRALNGNAHRSRSRVEKTKAPPAESGGASMVSGG